MSSVHSDRIECTWELDLSTLDPELPVFRYAQYILTVGDLA